MPDLGKEPGPFTDGPLSGLSDEDFEDLVYGSNLDPEAQEDFLRCLSELTYDDLERMLP